MLRVCTELELCAHCAVLYRKIMWFSNVQWWTRCALLNLISDGSYVDNLFFNLCSEMQVRFLILNSTRCQKLAKKTLCNLLRQLLSSLCNGHMTPICCTWRYTEQVPVANIHIFLFKRFCVQGMGYLYTIFWLTDGFVTWITQLHEYTKAQGFHKSI